MHSGEPGLLYVPEAQTEHAEEAREEYSLTPHAVHATAPPLA